MKQCSALRLNGSSAIKENCVTSNVKPTYMFDVSKDLAQMLKDSGLKDGEAQNKSTEFKFNFEIKDHCSPHKGNIPSHSKLNSPNDISKNGDSGAVIKNLNYKPSDNGFRFDFGQS